MQSKNERKKVLLGLTGGVAAYKAAELVRRLGDRGIEVHVVMTEAACGFITPATLQALSGHPVYTSMWDGRIENGMPHIELSRDKDAIVVAPATADFLQQLGIGLRHGFSRSRRMNSSLRTVNRTGHLPRARALVHRQCREYPADRYSSSGRHAHATLKPPSRSLPGRWAAAPPRGDSSNHPAAKTPAQSAPRAPAAARLPPSPARTSCSACGRCTGGVVLGTRLMS